MYHIIVKKLDKIVVWDSISIVNLPSQYKTDEEFIEDIFNSGHLSLYGHGDAKRDNEKTFNLTIINDETESVLYNIILSKTGVEYIYYLLATLEFMKFIYVKSLSIKCIYKRFIYDDMKRMLQDNPNAKDYFIKYIEPAINQCFKHSQDKLVTCLDMTVFENCFHKIEKTYMKLTPKDKMLIDQYHLYAILFASKNRYLNIVDIKNRI